MTQRRSQEEIPQSVILPYAEYKLLQECYDKQEAIELAPLIEERLSNIQADNSISHLTSSLFKIPKKESLNIGISKVF